MHYESAVLDVLNVSQLTNGMLVSSFIYCIFYQEMPYLKSPLSQSVSLNIFAMHFFFFPQKPFNCLFKLNLSKIQTRQKNAQVSISGES